MILAVRSPTPKLDAWIVGSTQPEVGSLGLNSTERTRREGRLLIGRAFLWNEDGAHDSVLAGELGRVRIG
jgi:hypothetical protein